MEVAGSREAVRKESRKAKKMRRDVKGEGRGIEGRGERGEGRGGEVGSNNDDKGHCSVW